MTEETRKRLHVRVTGRVQGVYYRASTRAEATRLGVSGWVRNTPDGAVEMELVGAPSAVADLVAWCHRGPPAARVARVETRALEPALEPDERGSAASISASSAGPGFEIRY